ncbi:MAG: DNA polymerase III subunit gamma/tau [Gammaproteobacteria bacterium]|nr:DNA polymerase III subunit gamma/tau [Gammaproteobacteria bacterium]
MSYQVLARKWRPSNFDEMVGQSHVLRALSSALENERLHHAYLFSGTRGVGKTTISRILAKSLNCEQGITAKPCGSCSACTEIDEGRFVDLIEVDAASRTKVEDTRELLENVQYRPTRGRYKVYLIDEVHMLSNHSFNALLKTLEEPPPHVVFLLATTDPQKLPPTVLSRCLQFHLKNIQPDDISQHLEHILGIEEIVFEKPALESLAWSAKGSMRDALSLLDQAIAFGDGKVTDVDVRDMLGSIDRDHIYRIIAALADNDGVSIISIVEELSQFAPDYGEILAEMLIVLHRIALIQQIPDATIATQEREQIAQLAGSISAEDIQLFYQLALHGRRDLPLAPDQRSGFEMSLLRIMRFRPIPAAKRVNSAGVTPAKKSESSLPDSVATAGSTPTVTTVEVASQNTGAIVSPLLRNQQLRNQKLRIVQTDSAPTANKEITKIPESEPQVQKESRNMEAELPASTANMQPETKAESEIKVVPEPEVKVELKTKTEKEEKAPQKEQSIPAPEANTYSEDLPAISEISQLNWHIVINNANISGVTEQMALNSQFISLDGEEIKLSLDHHVRTLINPEHLNKLTAAINGLYKGSLTIKITDAEPDFETPRQRKLRISDERYQEACDNLNSDTQVQALLKTFEATLDTETVETLLPEKI